MNYFTKWMEAYATPNQKGYGSNINRFGVFQVLIKALRRFTKYSLFFCKYIYIYNNIEKDFFSLEIKTFASLSYKLI